MSGADLPFRVGMGHDIHPLVPGRKLILGGVEVPSELGLLGHSDADALTHAIMDALVGALALGDIGQHFPDTDPAYAGADSIGLLGHVVALVAEQGYRVGNVDAMVHCERPKLAPFKNDMRGNLATALGISIGQVSVKAGTNEGFDAVGRGEAIACQAVVLLIRCGNGRGAAFGDEAIVC